MIGSFLRNAMAKRTAARRPVPAILAAVLAAVLMAAPDAAAALSNSADAFMSLPFGHSFSRTQKRMENSGAKVRTPREATLSMEGYFEGRPAIFVFTFHKKKGLRGKNVYLQSTGKADEDSGFYSLLMRGYNRRFGSVNETPVPNTWTAGRIMLRCVWTPDRWTTITLTYNPEAAGKRFPGGSMKDRPIHLVYSYSKWDG